MTLPTINGTPVFGITLPGTNAYTVTLPTGVVSGELIRVFAARRFDTLSTSDSGWTRHGPWTGTSGVGRFYSFDKISDGTETVLNLTGGGSYNGNRETHVAFRVGNPNATFWYVGTSVAGSNTTPDPPSLDPGLGAIDGMWMTVVTGDGRISYSAVPSGYTYIGHVNGGDYDRTTMLVAYKAINASSEDPGTWTVTNSGSYNYVAQTFVVPGTSGAAQAPPISRGCIF